jgi:hypothetical protein
LTLGLLSPSASLVSGYLALFSLVLASFLYIINRIHPMQGNSRIRIHCFLGFLSLLFVAVNVFLAPEELIVLSNLSFGLLALIVVTGFILKYVRSAGILRYQISTIHPGIVLALLAVLFFNWIVKRRVL